MQHVTYFLNSSVVGSMFTLTTQTCSACGVGSLLLAETTAAQGLNMSNYKYNLFVYLWMKLAAIF